MELNPYQAPQKPERARGPAVKAVVAAWVIVALTPLAVFVTGFLSCAAGVAYVGSIYTPADNAGNIPDDVTSRYDQAFLIIIIPPIVASAVMLWWAVRNYRINRAAGGNGSDV